MRAVCKPRVTRSLQIGKMEQQHIAFISREFNSFVKTLHSLSYRDAITPSDHKADDVTDASDTLIFQLHQIHAHALRVEVTSRYWSQDYDVQDLS